MSLVSPFQLCEKSQTLSPTVRTVGDPFLPFATLLVLFHRYDPPSLDEEILSKSNLYLNVCCFIRLRKTLYEHEAS